MVKRQRNAEQDDVLFGRLAGRSGLVKECDRRRKGGKRAACWTAALVGRISLKGSGKCDGWWLGNLEVGPSGSGRQTGGAGG